MRTRKLSDSGTCFLQVYILDNCLKPLYSMTGRLNEESNEHLSNFKTRHHLCKMNMRNGIAVHNLLQSRKKMIQCFYREFL